MSAMKTRKKRKDDISETSADGYNKQRMALVKMLLRMVLKVRKKLVAMIWIDLDLIVSLTT